MDDQRCAVAGGERESDYEKFISRVVTRKKIEFVRMEKSETGSIVMVI